MEMLFGIALLIGIAGVVLFFLTKPKHSSPRSNLPTVPEDFNPNADSDNDRINDGDEVNIYGTDPNSADTDRDGVADRDEILLRTDPLSADTDRDGLSDREEQTLGTDPTHWDSDRDGVGDLRDKD